MFMTYAIVVGLYKDRLYRGVQDTPAKRPLDLNFAYERVRSTERETPQWLAREQKRNSTLRRANKAIARATKKN